MPENALPDHDPLVGLGLLDPVTGRPVETPEWQPSAEEGQDGSPVSAPADDTSRWDTPDNPYFRQYKEAEIAAPRYMAQQHLRGVEAQLQSQRGVAIGTLVNQYQWPQQLAELVVDQQIEINKRDEREKVAQQVLGPTLQRQFAEEVAARHSTGGRQIDPKELAGERSVEAMEAKAKAIASTTRAGRWEQRKAAGTDRAEGGPPSGVAVSQAIQGLSPQQKIRLGIERGQ